MKSQLLFSGVVVLSLLGLTTVASAQRFTSPGYTIDASQIGASFGGQTSGGSYEIVSTGGESIIGQGSGGSYILDSGYVAQLQNSMELSVQPSGLVAYYPLDETSGTQTRDASSNQNDGTVGADSYWTTGQVNGGLDVSNTVNGVATIADNSDLPSGASVAMTVELWAYQDSSSADATMVSHWDYTGGTPTSGSWALQTGRTDSTRIVFFVADSATDPGSNYIETTTSSWSTGSWHHVAVTYDGSLAAADRAKVYIDGALESSTVTGTISGTLLDASSPLKIGDFVGLDRFFNGSLDEVKVYDRALGEAEIVAEYDAGLAGRTAGLSFTGDIIAGTSDTSDFDAIVRTDSFGYSLSVNQNQNLTKGGDSIPAISGTIGSPAVWSEGTTKGLGFTLFGTNATALDGKWSSGSNFAAFPGTATSVYTRTGQPQGTKDVLNLRLRLDVDSSQPSGKYTNVVTTTGTITP